MLLIVNKLTFYIAKLRIELILLVTLSLAKLTIFRTHLKGLPSVLTRGPEKPIRNTRREATLVREPPTCHFLLKFLRFRVSDLLQFPANELSLPLSRNWCYYIKNRRIRWTKRVHREIYASAIDFPLAFYIRIYYNICYAKQKL